MFRLLVCSQNYEDISIQFPFFCGCVIVLNCNVSNMYMKNKVNGSKNWHPYCEHTLFFSKSFLFVVSLTIVCKKMVVAAS